MLATAVTFLIMALFAIGIRLATDDANVVEVMQWFFLTFVALATATVIAHVAIGGLIGRAAPNHPRGASKRLPSDQAQGSTG